MVAGCSVGSLAGSGSGSKAHTAPPHARAPLLRHVCSQSVLKVAIPRLCLNLMKIQIWLVNSQAFMPFGRCGPLQC